MHKIEIIEIESQGPFDCTPAKFVLPCLIPKGMYCYRHTGKMRTVDRLYKDGTLKECEPYQMPETERCPYHRTDLSKDEMMDGYCAYLGQGDADFEHTGLLWDQCKECGYSDDDMEYEMEMASTLAEELETEDPPVSETTLAFVEKLKDVPVEVLENVYDKLIKEKNEPQNEAD